VGIFSGNAPPEVSGPGDKKPAQAAQ
jgi:hypothetical protein